MLHVNHHKGRCRSVDNNRRRRVMKLDKAIDRAIDRCNLIGDNCDIYSVLYSYKAIRDLPDDEIEKIYDRIVKILGFCW